MKKRRKAKPRKAIRAKKNGVTKSLPLTARFDDVKAALQKHRGILSSTAIELGVSREYLTRLVNATPELDEARKEALACYLDRVQTVLFDQAEAGDGPQIRYVLSTLGKHLGYSTKQEIAADVKQTTSTVFIYGNRDDVERRIAEHPGTRVILPTNGFESLDTEFVDAVSGPELIS